MDVYLKNLRPSQVWLRQTVRKSGPRVTQSTKVGTEKRKEENCSAATQRSRKCSRNTAPNAKSARLSVGQERNVFPPICMVSLSSQLTHSSSRPELVSST